MPFDQTQTAFVNPVTGRTFNGEKNLTILAAANLGPHWATFIQWKSAGRIVRKGEKGTLLFGRTFTFRVFEESQTGLVEPTETPVAAMVAPVTVRPTVPDQDTCALAAWYVCDVASKLFWCGHADQLDRETAAKVETITAKATRAKRTPTLPAGWHRHPVTGWPVKYNGNDLRDVIPYGHDKAMLAKVAKHYQTHARIGAANVLTMIEEAGEDAANYRHGLMSRRREQGPHRYNYGPQQIDRAAILSAVTYDDRGNEKPANIGRGRV